jgi:hypothetical protein
MREAAKQRAPGRHLHNRGHERRRHASGASYRDAVVGRSERDDRAQSVVPPEPLHPIRRNQSAFRVSDDREATEARVAIVQPRDLLVHERGKFVDPARVEPAAQAAQAERERSIAIAAKPPLEDEERSPRSEESVKEGDGAITMLEIRPPLDCVAGQPERQIPERRARVLSRSTQRRHDGAFFSSQPAR